MRGLLHFVGHFSMSAEDRVAGVLSLDSSARAGRKDRVGRRETRIAADLVIN